MGVRPRRSSSAMEVMKDAVVLQADATAHTMAGLGSHCGNDDVASDLQYDVDGSVPALRLADDIVYALQPGVGALALVPQAGAGKVVSKLQSDAVVTGTEECLCETGRDHYWASQFATPRLDTVDG